MMLHVTNGDSAARLLRESAIEGYGTCLERDLA